ncbi:MAG: alpha/beta hydrolase [Candidatus Zixiibacteriota bacterium]|nr:MAG: alpha/beta hydrolase [candidate division Zixibacteria bacterium]
MTASAKNKNFHDETARKYGNPPYNVAVIHGGPGAPGYMAPVARELSVAAGVIEPIQTEDSLTGQIEELEKQLINNTDPPVILIGSSWGAVLALLVAARKEIDIEKLILIGSAVFDAESSARIEGIRMSRLDDNKRRQLDKIRMELDNPDSRDKAKIAKDWGDIFFHTDVYDPIITDLEVIEVQYDINVKVWGDFVILRDTPGFLKEEFSKIDKPVMVIHGDYDPHPIEGIRPFLEDCLKDVRFHILSRCGHYPWIERHARQSFFDILKKEIAGPEY